MLNSIVALLATIFVGSGLWVLKLCWPFMGSLPDSHTVRRF